MSAKGTPAACNKLTPLFRMYADHFLAPEAKLLLQAGAVILFESATRFRKVPLAYYKKWLVSIYFFDIYAGFFEDNISSIFAIRYTNCISRKQLDMAREPAYYYNRYSTLSLYL
jgi:hypothetical protein